MEYTSRQRKALLIENRSWPAALIQVPREQWPITSEKVIEAWRSRNFFVAVYRERDGIERLSINRTTATKKSWADGISWEELQRLKRECGRGDLDAVEIFPADSDVVNVANMRHLWVLPERLSFAWRAKPRPPSGS